MGWNAPQDWPGGTPFVEGNLNEQIRDNFKYLKANTDYASPLELTISGGVVTKSQSFHTIDTEGEADSDDLDTISGGSAGQVIVICAEHTDRTVVVKHGTGNLQLAGGVDFSMDTTEKAMTLVYRGTKWLELGRTG